MKRKIAFFVLIVTVVAAVILVSCNNPVNTDEDSTSMFVVPGKDLIVKLG